MYFRWSDDGHLSATQPYIVGKTRKNVNQTDLTQSTVCLKVFYTFYFIYIDAD